MKGMGGNATEKKSPWYWPCLLVCFRYLQVEKKEEKQRTGGPEGETDGYTLYLTERHKKKERREGEPFFILHGQRGKERQLLGGGEKRTIPASRPALCSPCLFGKEGGGKEEKRGSEKRAKRIAATYLSSRRSRLASREGGRRKGSQEKGGHA